MAKKVKFYDGFDMTYQGINAFVEDWGGNPSTSPNYREAASTFPKFAGNRMNTNEFIVVVQFDQLVSGADVDQLRNTMLSLMFDETDLDSEHRIEVLMDAGTMNCYRLVVPVEITELHRTYFKVRFRSSRGEWINIYPQSITSAVTETTTMPLQRFRDTVNHPIPPTASAWPRYRVQWTQQRTTGGVAAGWKYETLWEVVNNETSAMRNECIRFNLGDTRSLVSGSKAMSSGDDVRVWVNGKEIRRDLMSWNTRSTMLWATIDEIPAGATQEVAVVYGNPSAGSPPRLQEGITRPAYSILSDNSATHSLHGTTASTSTTLILASSVWYTDMWNGAVVQVWDSAGNNSQSRTVVSNTGTTLTVNSAWTMNPTSTWSYVIHHSTNSRKSYWIKQSSHGSWSHGGATYNQRGGWSLNNGQKRPTAVRFADQVPGAWSRVRVLDNNDRVSQPRYSWLDVGGGDYDAFALFDTTRGQGQARKRIEDGQYDGVMISSVHGWITLSCNYVFYNPIRTSSTPTKGSCNFKIITMDEGGEDWTELMVDGVANENFTQRSTSTYDLSAEMPRHVGFCVVGRDPDGNDSEITTKLRKDKIATGRWGDFLYLEQDTTNFIVNQTQNEQEKYEVNVAIRLNGSSVYDDDIQTPVAKHGELKFGGAGHRVMILGSQSLIHDTVTGSTEIWDANDDLVKRVPYAAVVSAWENGSDGLLHRRIKRDAMAIPPPREYAVNGGFDGNITGWDMQYQIASSVISHSYSGAMGGLDINVTSHGSTLPNRLLYGVVNTSGRFAVKPGEIYIVSGRIRSTTTNLFPAMSFFFAAADGVMKEVTFPESELEHLPANTWYVRQTIVRAPVWARYAWVGCYAVNTNTGIGGTGHVYFDYVTTTDALIISEKFMGELEVTVDYEESWFQ